MVLLILNAMLEVRRLQDDHCLGWAAKIDTMRYLLLDRITSLSPPESATGVKCVSLSDDIFHDHFPGYPIMPGALILEGLAQLGGVLLEASMRERGRHDLHALLTMVERAKFRRLVQPGDKLDYTAKVLQLSEDGGKVKVTAMIEGKKAADAELMFAFAQVLNPRLIGLRRDVLNLWLRGSIEDPLDAQAPEPKL